VAENTDKADLRCVKTEKALDVAMRSLLEKRNFRKITVNDLCTEALISRATFYAHYTDKYDFLKKRISRVNIQGLTYDKPYEHLEKTINEFFLSNKPVIKNIVNDADKGTLDILFQLILSFLKLTTRSDKPYPNPEQIIFHHICAGGIMNHILWQVENNFPAEVPPMNRYLYKIITKCREIEPE